MWAGRPGAAPPPVAAGQSAPDAATSSAASPVTGTPVGRVRRLIPVPHEHPPTDSRSFRSPTDAGVTHGSPQAPAPDEERERESKPLLLDEGDSRRTAGSLACRAATLAHTLSAPCARIRPMGRLQRS